MKAKKCTKKNWKTPSTGIGDEWLSEDELREAKELGLDRKNYIIYRNAKNSDLYAEWEP